MLTEKDYCDLESIKALESLGMNVYTSFCGVDVLKHVLLYEAQKFLREEYNLHLEITYSPSCWTGKIYDLKEWAYIKGFTFFESFEDTLHILIKEAVKILKEE